MKIKDNHGTQKQIPESITESEDNHRYIYIRSTDEQVPVSKEVFDMYYKETNSFRRRMQRGGECCCPKNKRLFCDTDCVICPYRLVKHLSLDKIIDSDIGNETWADRNRDPIYDTEAIAIGAVDGEKMYARTCEMLPNAAEIGRLRVQEKKDADIAKEINSVSTTFRSRIDKAKKTLKKEFPEYLDIFEKTS